MCEYAMPIRIYLTGRGGNIRTNLGKQDTKLERGNVLDQNRVKYWAFITFHNLQVLLQKIC
jgi:hypothetical protein